MRTMGLILSQPDKRDYTIDMIPGLSIGVTAEPAKAIYVDPNVYDQLTSGMCITFAISSVVAAANLKEQGVIKRLSPGSIYAKRPSNAFNPDNVEGMQYRDGLTILLHDGIAEFRDFDVIGTFLQVRDKYNLRKSELIPLGYPNKIKGFFRLNNINEISAFIKFTGLPVLLGIPVYDSFMYNHDGIIGANSGTFYGYHAIEGEEVFYRNNAPRIKIKNSWGTRWGNNGFADIDASLVTEAWGIIDADPKQWIDEPTGFMFQTGSTQCIVERPSGTKTFEMNPGEYPVLEAARTKLPIRFPFEALGWIVDWGPISEGKVWVYVHKYPDPDNGQAKKLILG